jgi:hypothetical protein
VSIDPASGATVPDGAESPFPSSCEVAPDLVAQGLARLATQYRQSPKFIAMLTFLIQGVKDLADVAAQIPGLLDPAVATVKNLDVVGQLVGQSRVLSSGTEVSDTLFRGLIALRIARNASKGTSPELVAALTAVLSPPFQVSPIPFRYFDLGGMSVGLEAGTGTPPSADLRALVNGGPLPVAMGVGFSKAWYDPASYFGFDEDPDAKGFGIAGDATKGGKFAMAF